MWMVGSGIKRSLSVGETEDYCYNVVSDPIPVHDIHATILQCLAWAISTSPTRSRAASFA